LPYPGHTFLFFNKCIEYANIDIIDGSQLYENIFIFFPTSPLNDNFEAFGIENKNLLMQSGSYFIFLISLFTFMYLKIIINKVSVCNYQSKCFRTLGIQVFEPKMLTVLKLQVIKLFMESYFGICFFVVL
jgi:hypothetical protein